VRKYLTAWLDSLERSGLRANTIASYRRVITHHVVPYLGSRPLQSLTALDLDRLYSELLRDGARVDTKPGGLSPRSVRYAHTLISKALSEAERKGIVPRNVARAATPPSASSARAREMSTWTPTELDAFLESMAPHPLFPILRLAAMTGMRRGELCGLRWSDLDLDRGILSVARTVTTKSYDLIVNSPKTPRSRRTIDLDAKTIGILQAWRKVQVTQQLQAGPSWADGDGYVFTRSDGALLHPNTVGKVFDSGVLAAGLPRIRLHDLRHTHATLLLAAGENAKIVSERLGHSSVAFTLDRYAHVMPGQQANAAAAVAALVDGASMAGETVAALVDGAVVTKL
jgi:integrase